MFFSARKWGCVLLLDEADVFLAKRGKGGDNIDRNALVSVFSRILKYYSVILFLKINRIGSFDEAFKSRIHVPCTIPYSARARHSMSGSELEPAEQVQPRYLYRQI